MHKKQSLHRIAIVRREDKPIIEWKKRIETYGFQHDQKNPDLVLSIGGDGTFLIAEHRYPCIPKVLIRESNICNRCYNGTPDDLFRNLKAGNYTIHEHPKIEATFQGKTLTAVNDISIRNHLPTGALRFHIEGKKFEHLNNNELIGDGIVVATAFGAPAYYYAITKQTFTQGFGIAWNNIRTLTKPVLLPNINATLHLHRGSAVVSADNHTILHLKDGDILKLSTSATKARIIHIN